MIGTPNIEKFWSTLSILSYKVKYMEIRTIDESEYSNAKALLLKCYKKQAPMHIIEKEETLACVKDERVIGIASLWRNQLP